MVNWARNSLMLLALAACDGRSPVPEIELGVEPSIAFNTTPSLRARSIPVVEPVVTYRVVQAQPQRFADATPVDDAETVEVSPIEPMARVPRSSSESEDGFALVGSVVPPNSLQQLTWYASETLSGTSIPTPILVANGTVPGYVLCLTAAVHGDELNGIETVRRVVHNLNTAKLTGTVVGVPIVNIQAFYRHSRYLPDRRDLNRFFPGHSKGSSAARIAHSFFSEVISHCDGLVDLHTGSFHRTNLPQLRANLNDPSVVKLTKGFGSTIILHSTGGDGTLRRAAAESGIPAVTLEAGEPLRVHDDAVRHAVKGIHTLLDTLGMYNKRSLWGNPEPVYYTSRWVRADQGGILFSEVKLGKRVDVDDLLGTVTDPITNERLPIVASHKGRVIGMAVNQFVMPGFATYHIGLEAPMQEATTSYTADLAHAVAIPEDRDEFEE